jgi:hypothetical protein
MGTLDVVVSKEVMLSNKLGNFKIWRSTMKSILMKEDLWDLVKEPITVEESSKGGKRKAESSETEVPLITIELDRLRKRKQRTKSIIELSIELELRIHVEDEIDPRTTWKNLLSLFHTNTIADTMLVLNKWELLKMDE